MSGNMEQKFYYVRGFNKNERNKFQESNGTRCKIVPGNKLIRGVISLGKVQKSDEGEGNAYIYIRKFSVNKEVHAEILIFGYNGDRVINGAHYVQMGTNRPVEEAAATTDGKSVSIKETSGVISEYKKFLKGKKLWAVNSETIELIREHLFGMMSPYHPDFLQANFEVAEGVFSNINYPADEPIIFAGNWFRSNLEK